MVYNQKFKIKKQAREYHLVAYFK